LLPFLIPWWKNSVLNWDYCPGKKSFFAYQPWGVEPNYNIYRLGWPLFGSHATGRETKK
jgi:hypothetical protein